MKNNITIIRLFGGALKESADSAVDYKYMIQEATKRGYIVHPAVSNNTVLDYIKSESFDPNSTFYKQWNDVVSKSRLELFIDQIVHYITTYGTDFVMGNGYVPNTGAENVPDFTKFKLIMPLTEDELFTRCYKMLSANVAINEDAVTVLSDVCIDYINEGRDTNNTFVVDNISNREAMVYICDKLNIVPQDKFALWRYIIYCTTGKTMIINNMEMRSSILGSNHPFVFSKLSANDLKKLASIFYRFKELFVAFKHTTCSANKVYINKIRNLARKYHEPMKQPFWSNVFAVKHTEEELKAHLSEISNFKKVTLIQACLLNLQGVADKFYLVHNQKGYVRMNYTSKGENDKKYIELVHDVLLSSLINELAAHSKKEVTDAEGNIISVPKVVRIMDGVNVPLPISAKSFIGNYPIGTTFKLDTNNYIGVYWRNEWGTHDYDLSMLTFEGYKIGWNASYYSNDKDVIYSGDMTNAEPEASEVLLFKNSDNLCGQILVNQYNGKPESKFRIFYGSTPQLDMSSGYMVDPNTIKMHFDVDINGRAAYNIGIVNDHKFVLYPNTMGNSRVSSVSGLKQSYLNILMNKINCFVFAEPLLKKAGFTLVDSTYAGADVDIDFYNLAADELIGLMS